MDALRQWIDSSSPLVVGALASLAASLGTSVGALPVFFIPRASARAQDVLMSVSAGIMLAATVYSLVEPALAESQAQGASETLASLKVGVSVLLGAVAILFVHHHSPHEHFIKPLDTEADTTRMRQVWLFVIAITLHNFPEGMAVGVGFGGDSAENGLVLTAAIFAQNLPEGFVVALALVGLGYGRTRAVAIACLTGIVETVGGLFGATVVSIAVAVLPYALGFAGGAMLFVISHEIIPETHRHGHESHATFGLIAGFVLMLFLNATLG